MSRIGKGLNRIWTRLLVRRYRKEKERTARVDRDAAERQDQLRQGIQSYGKPGPTGW